MAFRVMSVEGKDWRVSPSGWVTQSDRDEFALVFEHGSGPSREVRVTRFSPTGTRARAQAFAELSDSDLARLFSSSQPGSMSPEAGYST